MKGVDGAARRHTSGSSLSLSLAANATGERRVAWSRPPFPKLAGTYGARRAKTDGAHGGKGGKEAGEGDREGEGTAAPAAAVPSNLKLGAEVSGNDAAKKGVGSGGKGLGSGRAEAGATSGGSGGGGVVGDLPHQVSELYAGT